MEIISRNELLEKLDTKKGKVTKIKIKGEYMIQIFFSKFNYNLEEEILKMQDLLRDSVISFCLNDVNFMGFENEELICMLNDTKDTTIRIK